MPPSARCRRDKELHYLLARSRSRAIMVATFSGVRRSASAIVCTDSAAECRVRKAVMSVWVQR